MWQELPRGGRSPHHGTHMEASCRLPDWVRFALAPRARGGVWPVVIADTEEQVRIHGADPYKVPSSAATSFNSFPRASLPHSALHSPNCPYAQSHPNSGASFFPRPSPSIIAPTSGFGLLEHLRIAPPDPQHFEMAL